MKNNASSVLNINNLSAGYNRHLILENVSFCLKKGEVLGLIGQNGSGKSTLMKTINGLIAPKGGTITIKGQDIKDVKTSNMVDNGVSFFTQKGLILPALTVREHLLLVTKNGENEIEKFQHVYEVFPQLQNIEEQRAGNLSGGERQMLSFAILLAQNTDIWFLDEPTAGLSPDKVYKTIEFLKVMSREKNITMLLVEHNMDVAFELSNNIIITKNKMVSRKFNNFEFQQDDFLKNHVYN